MKDLIEMGICRLNEVSFVVSNCTYVSFVVYCWICKIVIYYEDGTLTWSCGVLCFLVEFVLNAVFFQKCNQFFWGRDSGLV
jgi:hypothetical protein